MRVFYDLTCPFCYLAQPFNKQLVRTGVKLTEMPFQAHPEVPATGMYMGPRHGPMYEYIATRAKALRLPLRWRDVLPNSRLALAVAEWVRVHVPEKAEGVRERLFHAHFADDKDIGNLDTVLSIIEQSDVDPAIITAALNDGSAMNLVTKAETLGRALGVVSTPTFESDGKIISGLREEEIQRLVAVDK